MVTKYQDDNKHIKLHWQLKNTTRTTIKGTFSTFDKLLRVNSHWATAIATVPLTYDLGWIVPRKSNLLQSQPLMGTKPYCVRHLRHNPCHMPFNIKYVEFKWGCLLRLKHTYVLRTLSYASCSPYKPIHYNDNKNDLLGVQIVSNLTNNINILIAVCMFIWKRIVTSVNLHTKISQFKILIAICMFIWKWIVLSFIPRYLISTSQFWQIKIERHHKLHQTTKATQVS